MLEKQWIILFSGVESLKTEKDKAKFFFEDRTKVLTNFMADGMGWWKQQGFCWSHTSLGSNIGSAA